MQTSSVLAIVSFLAVLLSCAFAETDSVLDYDDLDEVMAKRAYAGPLIRFGKRSMQRALRNSPITDPLIRFGKRSDVIESKRPDHSPLIRFGKRAAFRSAPHIRFGKRSDDDALYEW
ncbi:unnamed protein product [Bursaphelenchus xylophilus]|uniref:(pine wood nematode) hypothetical protein n=1 Tax=Bursaphelenchus xylophilus TaxID=6326 RepID=A0A1I7S4H9_BURXY|nr:unnamed protein product [Bursaphelenchus xylophilus]CAG9117113.1 unnamed protein product [Bursaphelenchus xylophilus]